MATFHDDVKDDLDIFFGATDEFATSATVVEVDGLGGLLSYDIIVQSFHDDDPSYETTHGYLMCKQGDLNDPAAITRVTTTDGTFDVLDVTTDEFANVARIYLNRRS